MFAAIPILATLAAVAAPSGWTLDDDLVLVSAPTQNLVDAEIPEMTVRIAHDVFWGCDTLESVSFPSGLEKIDYGAFGYCTALKDIYLPDSVEAIGHDAFSGCTALESLRLSSSLREIPVQAFMRCQRLTTVTLPRSVTNVAERAFAECPSLYRVFAPQNISIAKTAFDDGVCIIPYATSVANLDWTDVMLDANGGDVDAASVRAVVGYAVGPLPMPRREGRVFAGWFDSPAGGSRVTPSAAAVRDMKLYAHWTANSFASGEGAEGWSRLADGSWRSDAASISDVSWLELAVYGPGEIAFDFRILAPQGRAYLSFYVDGKQKDFSLDQGVWEAKRFRVASGSRHVFRWEFETAKDATAQAYHGELRNIVWCGNETIPPLGDGATSDDVNAAITAAAFADDSVRTSISGDKTAYAAFRDWAASVGDAAVAASPHAAASFLLGADGLFANAPEIVFREVSPEGFSVAVMDGDAARPVASARLAALVECSADVSDWSNPLNPEIAELTPGTNALNSFSFAIPSNQRAFFMRLRK